MAYLTILAAFPESRLRAYRRDRSQPLQASLVSNCSHLVAYWVQIQPLGGLLGKAIDGGDPLHDELWHPLRPPLFHSPAAVQDLDRRLQEEWARVQREQPTLPADDWYAMEINKVLNVFSFAAGSGECVLTMLNSPADEERASRVEAPRLE